MNEKPIKDDELIALLTRIAKADTDEGADIFDHPCSVAVRRIQFLKDQINSKPCGVISE
jgi:hypothetical protein